MIPRNFSRSKFVKDLTRVRHMSTVSAVVLLTTFMPLLGMPQAYELRALESAVDAIADGRAYVTAPARNDEVARERSSRAVIRTAPTPRRSAARDETPDADGRLIVERDIPSEAEPRLEDAATDTVLPPADMLEPLAGDEEALPELRDEAPAPLPDAEASEIDKPDAPPQPDSAAPAPSEDAADD